jgi:SAM-dependent methyltransferase
MKSKWDKTSITTSFGSSYYDFGVIDYFDHLLECEIIDEMLGDRSGLSCLDLAAGNGRFTGHLLNRAIKITAVDLEQKHVSAIAQRFPATVVDAVLADAVEYVASTKDHFDVIVVSGLLLFVDDITISAFLANLRDRLNDNGVCIVRDFVSRSSSLALKSGVFNDTTLFYRPHSFYLENKFSENKVARPLHHFPKIEKSVFGFMGYWLYKLVWTSPLRAFSWSRSPYSNRILCYRKIPQ